MRFSFPTLLAALLALGCGPSARSTPTRSVDPSTLYVAQVHWSPSEITALGIVPAFPRNSWIALVAAGNYVRHARVGGPSRHECDDCVGPRMAVQLAIAEPPARPYAIGPADRRLPRITVVSETPLETATSSEEWTSTATFDLDEDATADLERVERCGGTVPTGCDEVACTRVCTATRTIGETAVRGELCAPRAVVPVPCVPPPPPLPEPPPEPVVTEPEVAPEPVVETPEEPATTEPETGTGRRRHWGSRRRPR